MTPTLTPIPFTPTPPATATALPTPTPQVITADNLAKVWEESWVSFDLSDYVSSEYFDFDSDPSIPAGKVFDATFLSYRLMDDGRLIGLLYKKSAECSRGETRATCFVLDATLAVVDLGNGSTLWEQVIPLNSSNLYTLAVEWSRDQGRVVVPMPDGVLIRDALSGEAWLSLPVSFTAYNASLSPDEKQLAVVVAGSRVDTLLLYDTATLTGTFDYQFPPYVTDLAWSDDGRLLAIGKADGSVDIVDTQEKQVTVVASRRYSSGDVGNYVGIGAFQIAFSKNAEKLAYMEIPPGLSEKYTSRFVIVDVRSKQEVLSTLDGKIYPGDGFTWAPDGQSLFVATINDLARIDLRDGSTRLQPFIRDPSLFADTCHGSLFPRQPILNEAQTKVTIIETLCKKAVVSTLRTYDIPPFVSTPEVPALPPTPGVSTFAAGTVKFSNFVLSNPTPNTLLIRFDYELPETLDLDNIILLAAVDACSAETNTTPAIPRIHAGTMNGEPNSEAAITVTYNGTATCEAPGFYLIVLDSASGETLHQEFIAIPFVLQN